MDKETTQKFRHPKVINAMKSHRNSKQNLIFTNVKTEMNFFSPRDTNSRQQTSMFDNELTFKPDNFVGAMDRSSSRKIMKQVDSYRQRSRMADFGTTNNSARSKEMMDFSDLAAHKLELQNQEGVHTTKVDNRNGMGTQPSIEDMKNKLKVIKRNQRSLKNRITSLDNQSSEITIH
jgi:hypothetical protein